MTPQLAAVQEEKAQSCWLLLSLFCRLQCYWYLCTPRPSTHNNRPSVSNGQYDANLWVQCTWMQLNIWTTINGEHFVNNRKMIHGWIFLVICQVIGRVTVPAVTCSHRPSLTAATALLHNPTCPFETVHIIITQ